MRENLRYAEICSGLSFVVRCYCMGFVLGDLLVAAKRVGFVFGKGYVWRDRRSRG